MTGHRISLKGFKLDKNGKVVRNPYRLDVSTRLRQQSSKKIRVGKKA